MGRKVTLVCDLCDKEIEKVVAKLYLAPILPNKTITSYQSLYSHHADLCEECAQLMMGKMKKRQRRESNGKVTQLKPQTRRRKVS